MLKRSNLAELRLDELTHEHAQQFASEFRNLSPSGINRGLRTLRRALNLAFKWDVIEKTVMVELAAGEVQRERVLTGAETESYLAACPQPWKDFATIIAEEAMRPGEVFALQWKHVLLNGDGTGTVRIAQGKSKAAKRTLPTTSKVHALLLARYEAQGCPEADSWIFPSNSEEGHVTGDGVKINTPEH